MPVYVQICGYDIVKNAPNSTVFANSSLNMTTAREWRFHSFPTPANLPAGHYFLVINGLAIAPSSSGNLSLYQSTSPVSLYLSNYSGSWQNGVQSQAFHYRLVLNWNRTCFPSELGMKVDISGNNKTVDDGSENGTGSVIVQDVPVGFYSTSFHVPIYLNRSVDFHVDYNYTARIKLDTSSVGYVNATGGSPNTWTILPTITRTAGNCWFTMDVPKNWYFLAVVKDNIDITNETQRTGTLIFIQNSSISLGSSWVITARSLAVPFVLNFPITTITLGQSISLSAIPPALSGQFTFIVYNTGSVVIWSESKVHGLAAVPFSYVIPENSFTGDAIVQIVWNNATDAGLQATTYTIVSPGHLELPYIIGAVVAIMSASFIGASVAYELLKRTRRRIEAEHLSMISRVRDLFNLNYVIVLEKKSGVDLYEQSFGEIKQDPTIISGFLSAITSFGLELTNTNEETQTIKLEYKASKILISEYKGFRITVIMKKTPSDAMIDAIKQLSYDIDEKYGKLLVNFSGETTEFQGIRTLIEKRFRVSVLAPLKIQAPSEEELSPIEKGLITKATEILRSSKKETFFANMLFPDQKIDAKEAAALFALFDRNIFTAKE